MSARKRAEAAVEYDEMIAQNQVYWTNINRSQKKKKKERKRKLNYNDFIDFECLNPLIVNDKEEWKPSSYNKDKQKYEYFVYRYFKYEAPLWAVNYVIDLYDSMYEKKMRAEVDTYYRRDRNPYNPEMVTIEESDLEIDTLFYCLSMGDILETLCTGGSLQKLFKGYLTKKEVQMLVKSNRPNLVEAIIEIKFTMLGYGQNFIEFAIGNYHFNAKPTRYSRGTETNYITSNKNIKYIEYMAKHNVDLDTFREIYDYYNAVYRFERFPEKEVIREGQREITMKDFFRRSFDNMLNNSNTWHTEQYFVKMIGKTQWERVFEPFMVEHDGIPYEMDEITSAKGLVAEGRALKHCVGSYANRCANGHSRILSLKINGERCITVEVNPRTRTVVQAKGKYNRDTKNHEFKFMTAWAQSFGLIVANYL